MAYDEELDARISDIVTPWGAERRKMFGGTGYMLRGNLLGGVHKDALILRLGEEEGATALTRPHVRPFDMTRHPMKGWVMVDPPGADGEALLDWLLLAREHAESLPPKS